MNRLTLFLAASDKGIANNPLFSTAYSSKGFSFAIGSFTT